MNRSHWKILLTALLVLAIAAGVIHAVWAEPAQTPDTPAAEEAVTAEGSDGGLLAFSSVSPLTLVAGGILLFAVTALAVIGKNRQK